MRYTDERESVHAVVTEVYEYCKVFGCPSRIGRSLECTHGQAGWSGRFVLRHVGSSLSASRAMVTKINNRGGRAHLRSSPPLSDWIRADMDGDTIAQDAERALVAAAVRAQEAEKTTDRPARVVKRKRKP